MLNFNNKTVFISGTSCVSHTKYGYVKLKKRLKRVKYFKKVLCSLLYDDEIYETQDGYFMNAATYKKLETKISLQNNIKRETDALNALKFIQEKSAKIKENIPDIFDTKCPRTVEPRYIVETFLKASFTTSASGIIIPSS